jgi:hypothetical protein
MQFSRDSARGVRRLAVRDGGGIAAGDGGGYTGVDDEFLPNARELLPDDLRRPLSTLAISSLFASPHNLFWIPLSWLTSGLMDSTFISAFDS